VLPAAQGLPLHSFTGIRLGVEPWDGGLGVMVMPVVMELMVVQFTHGGVAVLE